MIQSLFSRNHNLVAALTLALAASSTGCAVGVGASADDLAGDDQLMILDDAPPPMSHRDARLADLSEDAAAGALTEREQALLEIATRVEAGLDLDDLQQQVLDAARRRPDLDDQVLDSNEIELPEGPVTR